jgi:hypothetical protein
MVKEKEKRRRLMRRHSPDPLDRDIIAILLILVSVQCPDYFGFTAVVTHFE